MSDSILDEFSGEANELLDEAERSLLALDKDADFNLNYNSVFRAFHSVKGSAGMLGLIDLQQHVHLLEDRLQSLKTKPDELKLMINYFILGVDISRKILSGEKIDFKSSLKEYEVVSTPSGQHVKTEKFYVVAISISNKLLLEKIKNLTLNPLLRIKFVDLGAGPLKKADIVKSEASVLLIDTTLEKIKKEIGFIEIPLVIMGQDLDTVSVSNEVFHYSQDVGHGEEVGYILRNAIKYSSSLSLLDSAKKLILYMYSDVEEFLIDQKKIEIKNSINIQMKHFFKDYSSLK